MSLWGWLSLTIFGVAPMAAGIYFAVANDPARRRAIDATRRTEIIDGQEYSVYTLAHAVVKEKSTGRLGIALERGYYPWWIRIQFIRKTDGEPGRLEWRDSTKFETVGSASVDYLSRRTGLMRTRHLSRYNVDLASLRSTASPRARRRVHQYGSGRAKIDHEVTEAVVGGRKPNDANEQYRLGEAFSDGEGVPRNDREAAKWWLKAAEQGHAAAQHALALAYVDGTGVRRDLTQAYMWLSIELDALPIPGHDRVFFNPGPEEIIETIESKMAADQIADARRRAREWMPKSSTRSGQITTSTST